MLDVLLPSQALVYTLSELLVRFAVSGEAVSELPVQSWVASAVRSIMLTRLRNYTWSYVRYAHAVGAALWHPKQPLLHIVLHPAIPYVKYVAPVALLMAIGKLTCLDLMFIRMLADEDARRRRLAERAAVATGAESKRAAQQPRPA